jgi:hypothetical protein
MQKSNFGYKLFFFISLVVALANAAARGSEEDFEYDTPDPAEDTTTTKKSSRDTSLKFPIYRQA